MVLVDADAVVAQRVRVLELVHVLVVHAMTLDRVVQRLIDVDPHRTMLLPEVVGHVRPRHEVEPHELQGPLPSIVTPRVTRACLANVGEAPSSRAAFSYAVTSPGLGADDGHRTRVL